MRFVPGEFAAISRGEPVDERVEIVVADGVIDEADLARDGTLDAPRL